MSTPNLSSFLAPTLQAFQKAVEAALAGLQSAKDLAALSIDAATAQASQGLSDAYEQGRASIFAEKEKHLADLAEKINDNMFYLNTEAGLHLSRLTEQAHDAKASIEQQARDFTAPPVPPQIVTETAVLAEPVQPEGLDSEEIQAINAASRASEAIMTELSENTTPAPAPGEVPPASRGILRETPPAPEEVTAAANPPVVTDDVVKDGLANGTCVREEANQPVTPTPKKGRRKKQPDA